MAFSPDGQWLGCDNDSVFRIVDSRGAAPDLVISIPAISSPPVSET
jgi:hypothetical protein